MNNLQEKIEIIRAMDKGLTIQYSETDGEEDDWEDLKTTELEFDLYTYRVKPNSKPKSNPDARFKVGDKLVRIADEGKLNPLIVTIRDFASNGDYRWEEIKGQTNIEAIDANYLNINDVYWWHVIHYKKEDRYTLAPTMMKLGEIKGWANEVYEPMFSMGFRISRGEENESRRED